MRRIFNVSQPIVFPNGTMQYSFRDFIAEVDIAINDAALTSVWGTISGTLSTQTDLQTALNTAGGTAAWGSITGTLSAQTDLQDALDDAAAYAPPTVTDNAATPYTLVLGDANTAQRFTAASPAVTIPQNASVAFPVGTEVSIRQAGTGTLVLTTTGLTINGTVPAWAQHVEVLFRKVATDTWDVV